MNTPQLEDEARKVVLEVDRDWIRLRPRISLFYGFKPPHIFFLVYSGPTALSCARTATSTSTLGEETLPVPLSFQLFHSKEGRGPRGDD